MTSGKKEETKPAVKDAQANTTAAAEVELTSTQSPSGMNKKDMKCYSDRYSDLNGQDERDHYTMIGRDEGRLPTCAMNLTDIESQRYIDRYPDIQHMYGRRGKYAVAMARDNYTDFGFYDKRDVKPQQPFEEPWYCGEIDPENKNYFLSCGCSGRLWMGAVRDPLTNKRLDTFESLREWKTVSKDTSNEDWTDCSLASFGADPHPGKKTQCWCE